MVHNSAGMTSDPNMCHVMFRQSSARARARAGAGATLRDGRMYRERRSGGGGEYPELIGSREQDLKDFSPLTRSPSCPPVNTPPLSGLPDCTIFP
eukprot:768109-Hanusia_phi.AAC.8